MNFRIAVPFSQLQTPVMGTLHSLRDFFEPGVQKKKKKKKKKEREREIGE